MGNGSDTHIGRAERDTICLSVTPGQRVRIIAGALQGSEAVVVQQRTHGRVLVRIRRGVYVEIQQFCLEKSKRGHDK
jgi:transcription antitermination factor NusG